MKLSPWVFALIISCSLCFGLEKGQYGKDFEDMSRSEKILMYNTFDKSPALSTLFSIILPTSGHAYAGNWKRGIKIIAYSVPIGTMIGVISDALFYEGDENNCGASGRTACRQNTGPSIGAAFGLGISYLFSVLDAGRVTRKYNHNLYRDIFGKEPPSFSLNLQPTYQGANLTLAYKFD